MNLVDVYFLSYYISSGLLIAILAVLLLKVNKGSKFRFVKLVLWLLLISNTAAITYAIA